MLILPGSDAETACRLLGQIAESRKHCTIVVFGADERAQQIASRADVRAEDHPFRKVVLVPNAADLSEDDRFSALLSVAEGFDVVAMTIRFLVSSRLAGTDAMDFEKLEWAFSCALAGDTL
jgi:hypothetical protein